MRQNTGKRPYRRRRPDELSTQGRQLLLHIKELEMKGQEVTTAALTKLRGTRTGPTNRLLMRLKRRGLVSLLLDPDGDKSSRVWALKKEISNG